MPATPTPDALETLARLGAAVLAGGAIGLNRDLNNKPAGLRTHALVALGAALVTLASGVLAGGDAGALTRTVQGVITGIGFVGAGVIMHQGRSEQGVHGLTTAASIWVVAALGTACGAGDWVLVGMATALVLLVLVVGGTIERLFRRLFGAPPVRGAGQ